MLEALAIIGWLVAVCTTAVAVVAVLGSLGYRRQMAELRARFAETDAKSAEMGEKIRGWQERKMSPAEFRRYCDEHPGEDVVFLALGKGKADGTNTPRAADAEAGRRTGGAGHGLHTATAATPAAGERSGGEYDFAEFIYTADEAED